MNNLECVVAIIAKHREARQWADNDVAVDILQHLGLDVAADAANTTMASEAENVPSADEIDQAEAAAQDAMDRWTTLRSQRHEWERRRAATAATADTKPSAGTGPLGNEQPIADGMLPQAQPANVDLDPKIAGAVGMETGDAGRVGGGSTDDSARQQPDDQADRQREPDEHVSQDAQQ